MTYPPQQGPYGQPQPQHYGGNPQQQDPYGYGQPPPKKNNSAVLATVLFVVVLLAGVGITGFVAPGFFLSDDSSDAKGDGGSGGGSGDSGPEDGSAEGAGDTTPADVKKFAAKLVAAANDGDVAALREMPCADAENAVTQSLEEMDELDGAALAETREVSADEYIVVVDLTMTNKVVQFAATLANVDGAWCWQDFEKGTGPSGGGDSGDAAPPAGKEDTGGGSGGSGGDTVDGEAALQKFLDAVNAGEADKAIAMFCDGTRSKGDDTVKDVVGRSPNLTIGELQAPDGKFQRAVLAGTLDGKPISSSLMSVRVEGSNAGCIVSFIIT